MEDYTGWQTEDILDLIKETEANLNAMHDALNRRKGDEILKMRAELEAKAAALGVTLHDVMAIKEKKQRQPAAPKYRNPDNGRTWTGRGNRPYWLKDVENIEQYRIPE